MARPRLSEGTREELLEEGLRIFLERGYNGTGIKAVLDEVQVPKGSFYNYFKSKEDFALQIIRRYVEQFAETLEEVLHSSPNAYESFKSFFRKQIKCHEENSCSRGCLIGNLGTEISTSCECCREEMSKAWVNTEKYFSKILEKAQQQGSIRDDLSAEQLAGTILMSWQGALIRMQIDASAQPLKKFYSSMIEQFLKKQ